MRRTCFLNQCMTLSFACADRWEYLTEKLAYERRVRESKLKAAMIQVCVQTPFNIAVWLVL
jgi:hypothetical protein